MKKLRTVKLLLLAGLIVISPGLKAQDVLRLTLQDALQIALNDNPTIQIADLEIERQEYVRKETSGNLLPSLSGTAQYNRAVVKSSIDMGNGQKFSFEPDNTITGTLALNVPLFVPAIYRTLKMNDEEMRAATESARASKITLTNEVKKAYYNILLAEQSLDVLLRSKANLEQTVEETGNMYKAELVSEYELLSAQVQLSNLQPSIVQTENAITVAKRLLKMYLYLPEGLEIVVQGDLADYENDAIQASMTFSPDLSGNTDIIQLDIQESILEQQMRVLKTNRMPTLAAFGNFQFLGRDKISFAMMDDGSGSSSKSFETFTPLNVGVQLSIPIFAGNTNTNKERQLRNSIKQLQLQKDYLIQSVEVEAESIISNIVTARAQMIDNERTVKLAEKGYEITKARYTAGIGTILELNSSELSLTQARLNYSQSLYDLMSAQADYNKVLGLQ